MTNPEKTGASEELFPRRFGKIAVVQKFRHPDTGLVEDYVLFDTDTRPAMVLPLTTDQKIVAVRQFRYAANQRLIEFPGGNIEKNEPPEEIARRELLEETGYRAREIKALLEKPLWHDPSLLTTPVYAFIALGCEKVADPKPEADAYLEVLEFDVDTWLAMIRRGEVLDAKTIAATFLALPFLTENPYPARF